MHQLLGILVDRTFKNQCVTLDLEEEKLDEGKPLGTRDLPPEDFSFASQWKYLSCGRPKTRSHVWTIRKQKRCVSMATKARMAVDMKHHQLGQGHMNTPVGTGQFWSRPTEASRWLISEGFSSTYPRRSTWEIFCQHNIIFIPEHLSLTLVCCWMDTQEMLCCENMSTADH